MRPRKISILFAISFLLIFGSETATANDGDLLHYKFNHVYPERQDLAHLKNIAKKLKADPELVLSISSHACSIGTNDVNMRVSKMRAEIIAGYLGKQGVPQKQITTLWQGEESPIADNNTEQGRSVNRRSAFKLLKYGTVVPNDQPIVSTPKPGEERTINNGSGSNNYVHTPSGNIHHSNHHISSSSVTHESHSKKVSTQGGNYETYHVNSSPNSYVQNTPTPPSNHTTHSRHSNGHIQNSTNYNTSGNIHSSTSGVVQHPTNRIQNTTVTTTTNTPANTHISSSSHIANTTHSKSAISEEERLKPYENVDFVEINVDDIYNEVQQKKLQNNGSDLDKYEAVSNTLTPENKTTSNPHVTAYEKLADTFSPEDQKNQVKTTTQSSNVVTSNTSGTIDNKTTINTPVESKVNTETVRTTTRPSVATSPPSSSNPITDTKTGAVNPISNPSNVAINSSMNAPAPIGMGATKTQKIRIINEETGLPLERELDISAMGSNMQLTPNANGEIEVPVSAFNQVTDFYAKGYFYSSEIINDGSGVKTIKLKPAKKGAKLTLDNLYFQSGTANILADSYPELERLYNSLNRNEDIKVEIGGHINVPFVRPEDITPRQLKISQDRAKAVYDYLIGKGINRSRIEYYGYGNSEMIHPQAQTNEQKAQNRRVEVKIIK